MKPSEARKLALKNGEKFYIPENPCAKGHSLRRSNLGECVECKRICGKEYIEKNRAQYNLRKKRERSQKLPELALKMKEHRKNEPIEKANIRREQARLRAILWREKNPNDENTKVCKKTYRLNNPHKVQAHCAKRRVSKINRIPKWTTEKDLKAIQHIYGLAIDFSKAFNVKYHVDHIIPLQGKLVSGLHIPSNLQIIPAVDNIRKGNKFEVPA